MWNSGSDEDRLYHRAIEESYRILGSKGRDRKGWTREEMIAESGMSESAFTHTYLDFLEGKSRLRLCCFPLPIWILKLLSVEADHFHLHTRVLHSLKESLRVLRFASICQNLSPSGPVPEDDTRLVELGALLNASHDSCQYAYDCTAMETDLLRDLCLANGAIGSRQTGAIPSTVKMKCAAKFLCIYEGGGWGGAVVSLVPVGKAQEFLDSIKMKYPLYRGLGEDALNEAAFATLPGSGAGGELFPSALRRYL